MAPYWDGCVSTYPTPNKHKDTSNLCKNNAKMITKQQKHNEKQCGKIAPKSSQES